MTRLAQLEALLQRTPFSSLLGLRLEALAPERVVMSLPLRRDFLQEEGIVHGGVITSLADTSCVYLVMQDLPPARGLTGVEFKMSFVRPAILEGGELLARATPLRIGRTLAVCEAEVLQADVVVAKGLFTYMLLERRA